MQNLCKRASLKIAGLYSARRLKLLLGAAFAFFWFFNFSSAPFSVPSFSRTTGQSFLDILPFYTSAEAFTSVGQYGEKGRELYLHFLAADFTFIPIYGLAFALLFTRALQARFGAGHGWLCLNLLPIVIGLFDCVENTCIVSMLLMYPKTSWLVGTLSGFATAAKWGMTLVSLLVLCYLGMSLVARRFAGSRYR